MAPWRSNHEIGLSKSGDEKRPVYFKQTIAAVSWSPRESRTHTNSDISPHWRTASQGNVRVRIHALLRLCHKTPQAIAAFPVAFVAAAGLIQISLIRRRWWMGTLMKATRRRLNFPTQIPKVAEIEVKIRKQEWPLSSEREDWD